MTLVRRSAEIMWRKPSVSAVRVEHSWALVLRCVAGLIGRAGELELIEGFLRTAQALGAAMLLLGESGVGKTAVIEVARELVLARIVFALRRTSDAPDLLLTAARRLEPLDVALARDAYLEALAAAFAVEPLTSGNCVLKAAQGSAGGGPSPRPPRAPDLLRDGLALLVTEGHDADADAETLPAALVAFGSEGLPPEKGMRWLWLARVAAALWDDEAHNPLATR
jgi:hypothetical protein